MSWREAFERASALLDEIDPERKLRLPPEGLARLEPLEEEIKERMVSEVAGGRVGEARAWISALESSMERAKEALGVGEVLLSKEMGSFSRDPEAHLRKKLLNYVHDLLRGILSPEEFERKARAAIVTSIRTNMRSIYQSWVFLEVLAGLAERGYLLTYPEMRYLSLERGRAQRAGRIPPNAVLSGPRGSISFFLEAPRPLGWGDGRDLASIWPLYTALRPDVMAYGGRVLNIVRLGGDPPILRPDVILECKELEDWYARVRDVRWKLARPMSVDEWKGAWLEGLWDGLAGILGVSRGEAATRVRRGGGIRLREPEIVTLYASVYRPESAILVSRCEVPAGVRSRLEAAGILVLDGVGFDRRELEPVVDLLEEHAKGPGPTAFRLLEEMARSLGVEPSEDLLRAALEVAAEHREEVAERLRRSR